MHRKANTHTLHRHSRFDGERTLNIRMCAHPRRFNKIQDKLFVDFTDFCQFKQFRVCFSFFLLHSHCTGDCGDMKCEKKNNITNHHHNFHALLMKVS